MRNRNKNVQTSNQSCRNTMSQVNIYYRISSSSPHCEFLSGKWENGSCLDYHALRQKYFFGHSNARHSLSLVWGRSSCYRLQRKHRYLHRPTHYIHVHTSLFYHWPSALEPTLSVDLFHFVNWWASASIRSLKTALFSLGISLLIFVHCKKLYINV